MIRVKRLLNKRSEGRSPTAAARASSARVRVLPETPDYTAVRESVKTLFSFWNKLHSFLDDMDNLGMIRLLSSGR
jgi:hypothetical protein